MLKKYVWTLALLAGTISAKSTWDQFRDPLDGKLDVSEWALENAHGFLLFPALITDPAIGNGGLLGAIFFHETEEQKEERRRTNTATTISPSVSGIVGGGTNNGTQFFGAFHSGNWLNDGIRYEGGIFQGLINIDFYGAGDPVKMTADGFLTQHDLDIRIANSNWFVNGGYKLSGGDLNFEGVGKTESRDAAFSYGLLYESLDNQFSPNNGIKARVKVSEHGSYAGGDHDFTRFNSYINAYQTLSDKWRVSGRVVATAVSEGAPAWELPFIDIRGIPAMRYQGEQVASAEVELAYALNSRWELIGFTGAGSAYNQGQDSELQTIYGGGFRHLIARQLGLKWGIDIAQHKNDTAVYLQFGSAW
ncbi:BamA/TamA family outer membrane protein [Agarivorans sp. DSG3-1]